MRSEELGIVAMAKTLTYGLQILAHDGTLAAGDDDSGGVGRKIELGRRLMDDGKGHHKIGHGRIELTHLLGTGEDLLVHLAVVGAHGGEIVTVEHAGEDDGTAPL